MERMACLYAKTSGTGILLLALMYIRVAASLANNKWFVSSDFIAPSPRGERSTHSTPSPNEIRIVQLKLPHAGTWEVSQKQYCPPRSLLPKRQRAGALNSAYWKTDARSYFDSIAYRGSYSLENDWKWLPSQRTSLCCWIPERLSTLEDLLKSVIDVAHQQRRWLWDWETLWRLSRPSRYGSGW